MPRIVVIGAGVSGLTCALLLAKQSKDNAVTVVAKHMPGDYDVEYTSPWAGANVLPMALEKDSRYERRTWPELRRLAAEVPESGIHFQRARVLRRKQDYQANGEFKGALSDGLFACSPWYKDVMDNYRELPSSELPEGIHSGCEFTSVCINTAIYLSWLVSQLAAHGVVFKRAVLRHISEAAGMHHTGQKADIVINASGLLACKLGGVMDSAVIPARGQIIVVRNECPDLGYMVSTSGSDDGDGDEMCYTMTRALGGGTILGGTYQKGNWDSQPDPNIAVRIMKRVVDNYPQLTGGKGIEAFSIIRHGVGLRPFRNGGARIEKEKLEDGTWVVHNYGHAGWGYQASYGCAEHVLELISIPQTSAPQPATMADRNVPIHQQAIRLALDIANGRHALSAFVPPALLLADAALCMLIIWKIPYTEIDWTAYMEQVSQFVSGERDYTKMEGGTGPLVYPAAHVYTYTGLYYLTDHGKDIFTAQWLFAMLYMATLGVVMACYWQAKAPPYIFPLLILSKRLHSIFVLRCFNDCFAVFFLWLAIFFLQRCNWQLGALLYTWGLGIKMSLLLVLPAVGVVLFLGAGFQASLVLAVTIALVQLLIAGPFLADNPWGYFGRAFEFSRQFLFKWTVNWRFMGENAFLSRQFALTLLGLHVVVLLGFITTKWLKPARKNIIQLVTPMMSGKSPFNELEQVAVSRDITPRYILTTILSANVIGLLFARSLHYQFYSYLAWSTPFLLWRSGIHPVLQYGLWAAQEWAWNVFPSTPTSSGVVVGVMALTVALVGMVDQDISASLDPDGVAEPRLELDKDGLGVG
ncbi:Dol-P-Man:Man(5)GlcNAc(2)-PP-Dol alpha-1 3-mannosyltransferase [Diplogelasinospora grovesii]|uniref:Dol-P-Man:Man(5)GlcNAc(2)-PP-Dol alpha-1,3-mannosyltransferase n=1 Tax=Diplogelasinospora grovesii TaxID=303347 RepID=A0AAN6NFP6_9PEZI|nr:Dol-P-Man:Man(5)GlcNAc(2)-PP-Dol alpha-1 3-mannosyltransferase [Diplogelasinospora grovesii]